MSAGVLTVIEQSERIVSALIENRPKPQVNHERVAASEIIGRLIMPTLAEYPRGEATQLVVIAGGAASGKSTLAKNVSDVFERQNRRRKRPEQKVSVATISSDSFVMHDREQRNKLEEDGMPPEDKYDFDRMREAIDAICANRDPDQTVEVPEYDSRSGLALDGLYRRQISPVDVLIVEGDMLGERGRSPRHLYSGPMPKPLVAYMHVPDTERFQRRLDRDLVERKSPGVTRESIAESYIRRQESQHVPYTLTYATSADIILTQAIPFIGQSGSEVSAYNVHVMQTTPV